MLDEAEKERLIQGTLDWCNHIRAQENKPQLTKLPKGKIRDGESCPCGKATDLYVGRTVFLPIKEHRQAIVRNSPPKISDGEKLPRVVQEFITQFDKQEFPELIEI